MPGRRRFLAMLAALPLWGACNRTQESPGLRVGDHLPELVFPGLEGGISTLPAVGSLSLINLWATWCVPCRAEMAGLERVSQGLGRNGLKVIGISVDSDPNLVREYLLKERLSFPVLLDHAGQMARQHWGVNAYPRTLLVGADGLVLASWLGEQDWDQPAVRRLLEQALAGLLA